MGMKALPSLYEVLGAAPTDDDDAVKRAYRKCCLTFHPDKNKDDDATEQFQRVSEAYAVLGDVAKRRAYDKGRRDPVADARRRARERDARFAADRRRSVEVAAKREAGERARAAADAARNAAFVKRTSRTYVDRAVEAVEARSAKRSGASPLVARAAAAAARQSAAAEAAAQRREAAAFAAAADASDDESVADHAEWAEIAKGLGAPTGSDARAAAAARMKAELERYRAAWDSDLADMMADELERIDRADAVEKRSRRSPSELWADLSAPPAPAPPASPRGSASPRRRRATATGVDVAACAAGAEFLARRRGVARSVRVWLADDGAALHWRCEGDGVHDRLAVADLMAVEIRTRSLAAVLWLQTPYCRRAFEFPPGASPAPDVWRATLVYLSAGGWITRSGAAS